MFSTSSFYLILSLLISHYWCFPFTYFIAFHFISSHFHLISPFFLYKRIRVYSSIISCISSIHPSIYLSIYLAKYLFVFFSLFPSHFRFSFFVFVFRSSFFVVRSSFFVFASSEFAFFHWCFLVLVFLGYWGKRKK